MRSPLLAPILAWAAGPPLVALVLAVLLLLPAGAAARSRWRWPARGQVVARFHFDPPRRFARGQRRGIVVAAAPGAALRAACDGRVTFAGRVGRSGLVVSQSCGRLTATYLRLGAVAARRGRWLARGDAVGTVGARGRYGLGARVRSDPDGYVDPLRLLRGAPAATPRVTTPPPRVLPLPVPRPAPLPPVRRPAPVPRSAPAGRSAPSPIGLPLGIWWLPTGLALLGAAALIALARRLAQEARVRTRDARPERRPTTESRPT